MDKKSSYVAPAIAIGLLLLPYLYAGSYYATAQRVQLEWLVK